MVILSETCSFSGKTIYPYRGTVLVRADCKALPCLNKKIRILQEGKKKNVHFEWTLAFRRKNKKAKKNIVIKKEKKIK